MPTTDQLRQIATQVGVSLSTVYRVLNGDIKGRRADHAARSDEVGRTAVRMLLEKIAQPKLPLPPKSIPYQLTPGQSTRAI